MNRSHPPADEILDSLGLPLARPGLGYLQSLFARFNERVPFETASKILRHAEVADPALEPRSPEIFWKDHLERGAGGTCYARVAAFESLLTELGFAAQKVFGSIERDFDHAALLISLGETPWICDVGFPLPALLPAREGKVETALADLTIARSARGFRVELISGVPEGPRALEIFEKAVSEEEFREHWRATLRPDSRFLSGVALRKEEAQRVISFSRGQVRVDDRHSRLTVPIASPRAERLANLFQIDQDLLERAFALAQDAEPQRGESRLTAYLETRVAADTAFAAIGSPKSYRRLLEGVARIISEEETETGWRVLLGTPAGEAAPTAEAALCEEVVADPGRFALRVERRFPGSKRSFASEFRVEERLGRTYLIREAFFDEPREDLLRNDSLRGRMAGTLAVDLLAWKRLFD